VVNFAQLFRCRCWQTFTAWMAVSRWRRRPVGFYAAVFFLVKRRLTSPYLGAYRARPVQGRRAEERRIMRFRSITTLVIFARPRFGALKYPLWDSGIF